MSKKYGFFEAMDLDYLNKHPDCPIMFRPVKKTSGWWGVLALAIVAIASWVIAVLMLRYGL